MASIIFQQYDGTEIRVELVAATISFGKGEDNDIVLEDPSISSRHGQISYEDEDFYITDLDSTNGTRINGKKISRHRLASSDQIEIGTLKGVFYAGSEKQISPAKKTRPKAGQPSPERKRPSPAPTPASRRAQSPPRAASTKEKPGDRLRGNLQRKPVPEHAAKESPHRQQDSIGFHLFVMQFLAVIVALLGLSVRHYIETGGFFLADAFHELRHIETEGPVYDAEGNLVEDPPSGEDSP